MSLWSIGTPSKGEATPSARALSAWTAAARAPGLSSEITAFNVGFNVSVRAIASSTSSREETCLASNCRASEEIVSNGPVINRALLGQESSLARWPARFASNPPYRPRSLYDPFSVAAHYRVG